MPGGEAGESASTTPRPKRLVITTATDVSRPISGVRPTTAIATAAPEHADGAAGEKRQPEQRGADEPRKERVGQRLGAVGQLVEHDPARRARRRRRRAGRARAGRAA